MKNVYLPIFILLFTCGFLQTGRAQGAKNLGVYVGYALINEPVVTLEYRVSPRIAVNLEGAGIFPMKREATWGMFSGLVARPNYRGGAIRTGISIYGRRRPHIMHRVLFDLMYLSSNKFTERYGVLAIEDVFYRELMHYGVLYELTFRFSRERKHHLFIRAGMGIRGIHRTTVSSRNNMTGETVSPTPYRFETGFAPLLSVGYRFRIYAFKDYFVGEN